MHGFRQVWLALGLFPGLAGSARAAPQYYAYVGGSDHRIDVYHFDAEAGSLALVQHFPLPAATTSFLAFHHTQPWVYATDESYGGGLVALAIDPATGRLRRLNDARMAEGGPTHVTVDHTGKYVLSASYSSGHIQSYPIQADGRLGPLAADLGAGIKAHQIVNPAASDIVYVPCLGSNYIATYELDAATGQLNPTEPPTLNTGTGGPRHVVFHPHQPWSYLIKEESSQLQALHLDADSKQLSLLGSAVSTRARSEGLNTAAEVQLHPSGSYAYASNRGDDSVAWFDVQSDGTLAFKSAVSSGGTTPRHFSIAPDGRWLLVANQGSGSVQVFKLDPATGALSATAHGINVRAAQFV